MFRQIADFFRSNQGLNAGGGLYAQLIVPAVLAPALNACALEDTFSSRFEALILLASIAIWAPGSAMDTAARQGEERAFVTRLIADIDTSFRERSLGDATVKKHAKNHAAAAYGRLRAYEGMLTAPTPDLEILQRNLFADQPSAAQTAALTQIIPQCTALVRAITT